MSTIVLLGMLCTKPLTMHDGVKDSEIIQNNCSLVVKGFTSDHKQCDEVMRAFLRTTGDLSMPGYYICQAEVGDDPNMKITPVKYTIPGKKT